MDQQVLDFLRQKKWAVYGVSANEKKISHRIYQVLQRYEYEVYAINPKEKTIAGEPCYASLAALPAIPDVVDFVVPPAVALTALPECKKLGIRKVWLQPGVNTPEVVALAKQLDLEVIDYTCVFVESNQLAILRNKPTFAVIQADTAETEQELRTIAASGVEYVWFQPAASHEPLFELALGLKLLFVHDVELAESFANPPAGR